MNRPAPKLVHVGGDVPAEAVFLSGHNALGQQAEPKANDPRPLYAFDEARKVWRLVQLVWLP